MHHGLLLLAFETGGTRHITLPKKPGKEDAFMTLCEETPQALCRMLQYKKYTPTQLPNVQGLLQRLHSAAQLIPLQQQGPPAPVVRGAYRIRHCGVWVLR